MTEKRYDEKLKELRARCPQSPFLVFLARGYSAVNVVYLIKAFESIGNGQLVMGNAKIVATYADSLPITNHALPIADLYLSASDAVLQELDMQRRGLYRELFVERKRFFELPFTGAYDGDRALVSDAVQGIQKRIKGLKLRIEGYCETGKLPDVVVESKEDKVFEVPSDPYLRMKKLNSLRAGVSRVEREIKQLVGMGALESDDRVVKKVKDRVYLRGCLRLVEEAVKELKV